MQFSVYFTHADACAAVTWNLRYVIHEMDRCAALVGTHRSQTRRGEVIGEQVISSHLVRCGTNHPSRRRHLTLNAITNDHTVAALLMTSWRYLLSSCVSEPITLRDAAEFAMCEIDSFSRGGPAYDIFVCSVIWPRCE